MSENKEGWSFDDLPERGVGVAFRPYQKYLEPLQGKGRLLLAIVLVALGGVMAASSFFQLEPEEEAVVLRLGEPIPGRFGPGLHTKIPFVDEVFAVPVNRQHRLEFGFRSQPGVITKVSGGNFTTESLMLTGDLMLVHVRWSLVYKIDDIHTWLFKIKDRESTIRDISMGVMRQIVGDYSLDEVLTTKQLEIANLAHSESQSALREKVPTGVHITEVAIKSADVPEKARKAFDDLTRTLAKVQGELAEAKAAQDNVIGRARREKNETIGKAEKELAQVVENAHGEASAFLAKAQEYNLAPEITRQWMYLKTMTKVLKRLDEKIIIEDSKGSAVSMHLPIKDFFPPQKGGSK
jgi:modulator of FtsH protease HflK